MSSEWILAIVFSLLGIALIWFVIESIVTLKATRKTMEEMSEKIGPTLNHVESIASSLDPAMKKVDPLIDRVSLTLDAANLEIMRLDGIMEDVSEITETASEAVNALDAVAQAPSKAVHTIASKVGDALSPKTASRQTVRLGKGKAAATKSDAQLSSSAAAASETPVKTVPAEEAQTALDDLLESLMDEKVNAAQPDKSAPETNEMVDAVEALDAIKITKPVETEQEAVAVDTEDAKA